MGNRYYTLITGLPHLPKRFDAGHRPPISRPRLEGWLTNQLKSDDAEVAEDMIAYLRWARHTQDETVEDVQEFCEGLLEKTSSRVLGDIVCFVMDIRTILVALRMRLKKMPKPEAGEEWGLGSLVPVICKNWDVKDFGLARTYAWVPEFASLLEKGDSLTLEKRINEVMWDFFRKRGEGHYFTFEAVLIYLGMWDIVDRWTSYNARAAAEKHAGLVMEAIGEQAKIFG